MPNAVVLRSDIQIESTLENRLWTVFHDIPRLYESLLRHLAPLGLNTADIRTEPGDGTLAGFNVQFWLLRFRLLVRVRLDQLECQWNELPAQDLPRFVEAVDQVIAAVAAAGEGTVPRVHQISSALHIGLEQSNAVDVIRRLVPVYPEIGPGQPLTAGVAFYFGPRDEVVSYSVGLEPSALFPPGLFSRITLNCDGRLHATQAQELVEGLIHDTIRAAGFDWKREPS